MFKISVIIPVYNASKFLRKTIESVLKQTLKDIEVICVDDGSTDDSLKILNELKTKCSFLKIITQKNQGPAIARNNGMKNANGEFIAFLDADDIFVDENALEEMYNFAKKNNLNIVSSNLKFIEPDYSLHDNPHYEAGDYACFDRYDIIHPKDYGIPYSFYKNIFNRKFLNSNKIDFPNCVPGEDPIFLAHVFANTSEIGIVPLTLYGYNHSIGGGVNANITTYEKKKNYILHFKEVCSILDCVNLNETSDFYKIHLFRYLTWSENNRDNEIFEIFNEIWDIENTFFDERDFNYTRFIVPCYLYFINKFNSDEFFLKANKKFLGINIYDTFAIDEKIIDDYFLVIYSYSYDDFKVNYVKYLENNSNFNQEFIIFKIKKFIFNLDISNSQVVFENTKNLILNNSIWDSDYVSKNLLRKALFIIQNDDVNIYKENLPPVLR